MGYLPPWKAGSLNTSSWSHVIGEMSGCAGINRRGVVDVRATQERSSEPSCPRVMRSQSRGWVRSVDRGTCRLDIELRNNRLQSADAVQTGGRQHRRMRKREHSQDSAQSENPGMHGNSTRENRETPSTPEKWK